MECPERRLLGRLLAMYRVALVPVATAWPYPASGSNQGVHGKPSSGGGPPGRELGTGA